MKTVYTITVKINAYFICPHSFNDSSDLMFEQSPQVEVDFTAIFHKTTLYLEWLSLCLDHMI